ncbi:MAG: type III polyketide synthase [Bacteroidota bacterium]
MEHHNRAAAFITHIGTATPEHRISQEEAARFMVTMLDPDERDARRLHAIYRSTAIDHRHAVLPDFRQHADFTFFSPNGQAPPTTRQRMEVYRQHATDLGIAAIRDGIPEDLVAGVTHLITVSCTGMYAPGMDIELIERLGLPHQTQRSNILFMGCYASFNAMKLADAICRAQPDARVLVVSVELCSLHFQKDLSDDNLIANALFADGAGALLIQSQPTGGWNLSLDRFHCDLAVQGKEEMAWQVMDAGFEMKLSSYVPEVLREGVDRLISGLLASQPIALEGIAHFAIHPGGRKILEVIEQRLKLPRERNAPAYSVLRQCGNMSSATILFVLKALLQPLQREADGEALLSMAFGPGLTLESALMRLHYV